MLGHNGRYVYHSNGQGPEDADFIPARPPFHYGAKNLFIEIYFDDHSAAWSFGDGGDLGPDLSMIARDQHGNIVETDAEALFPEVDGSLVPEHDELIRYVDVANAELLQLAAELPPLFPSADFEVDGIRLERPEVASAIDALAFPMERLRAWKSVAVRNWNGYTTFGTAVTDGLISEAEHAAIAAQLPQMMKRSTILQSIDFALDGFDDRKALLAKFRAIDFGPDPLSA